MKKEDEQEEKLIYKFKEKGELSIRKLGGKGHSLCYAGQKGFNVPPGFVLTVEFFRPWLEFVKNTPEWHAILRCTPKTLRKKGEALQRACFGLSFLDEQASQVDLAMKDLKKASDIRFYAVRSSSPEEDLESHSFAGGYETSLAVAPNMLEEAIKRSFVSMFSERVLKYKINSGLNFKEPSIAIVVQVLINSDSSGVAFSLNPKNNCYDESVIESNFGLGESVVSGLVSPDHFVVEKQSFKIIENVIGSKEMEIRPGREGATFRKSSDFSDSPSLSDDQVLAVADLSFGVEKIYTKPMDIEWAFKDGELFLLQARPITSYFPLRDKMITEAGKKKVLYVDVTDCKHESVDSLSGRTYVNCSYLLKMLPGKEFLMLLNSFDRTFGAKLDNVDTKIYRAKKLPKNLKYYRLKLLISSCKRRLLGKKMNKELMWNKERDRILNEDLPDLVIPCDDQTSEEPEFTKNINPAKSFPRFIDSRGRILFTGKKNTY